MGWSIKKPLGNDPIKTFTLGAVSGKGTPAQEGPANPWSATEVRNALAGLQNTSEYNFLKDSPLFAGKADAAFGDWAKAIGAPSSVDAVRSEIDSQQLQEILNQADQDTAQAIGQARTSALEGGWGGAGLSSDIEAVGVGRAIGEGTKAKTAARLGYATKALDREAEKEKALADALGLRYTTGAGMLQSEASLQNSRDLALANIMSGAESTSAQTLASLFNQGASNQIQGRTARQPGLLEGILRNTNISVG